MGSPDIPSLNNVLVVWKSSGGAGSSSLVEAAQRAVGHRAQVAHLHLDHGSVGVRSTPADPAIARSAVASARALSAAYELVLIEIEGAHRQAPETNAELLAVAWLAEAGAVTALVAESRSTHSLAVGLSRMLTVVSTAPASDPSRYVVVLNSATDEMGTSLIRVEEHLVNIGVANVHIAERGATTARKATKSAPLTVARSTLDGVAYDILSDMDLPCLRVTDATIDGLLGERSSRPAVAEVHDCTEAERRGA